MGFLDGAELSLAKYAGLFFVRSFYDICGRCTNSKLESAVSISGLQGTLAPAKKGDCAVPLAFHDFDEPMIKISCFTNEDVTCFPDFAPRQWVSNPSVLRFPPGTTVIQKLAGSGKWNKVEVVNLRAFHGPHTVFDLEFMGNHDEPVSSLIVEGFIAWRRAEY